MTEQYVMSEPAPWRRMDRSELIDRLLSISEIHTRNEDSWQCRACLETYPCATTIVATSGDIE